MKILHLCTFYHRAMLFRQQMDGMSRRGHYVRAFNSAMRGEGIAEKFKPIMDDMVKHVECYQLLDAELYYPRQWKTEAALLHAYQITDFDLIHAHMLFNGGYTALRMKKRYGKPYVVSVRMADFTGHISIRAPYFKGFAKKILDNASGVLFLSNSSKKDLCRILLNEEQQAALEKKCVVIGNALEPYWSEHHAEPRSGKFDPSKELRLLAVAKIQPSKNLATAALAVEELQRRGYKASLTVIGEDQNHRELEKITSHPCVNYISFMGKEALCEQYAAHDIFLLPSRNETFGRVYAEAMTQGLPVLYSADQGFDGYFPEGEVGYAVQSGDPSDIADKVEKILKDYPAISARCVSGSSLFDEKIILDALERFYNNALTVNR